MDGDLTSLSGVSVTTDGNDPGLVSSWTSFTNGSLQVNSSLGVTAALLSLPIGLTDIDGSSLYAQGGGSLALPGVTTYAFNNSTFQAYGAGSVLDVSSLTTLTQMGVWDVEAYNGGDVKLTSLASLTDTQGITFQAVGTGSLLDVSKLSDVTQSGGWAVEVTNGGEVNLSGLTSVTSSQNVTFQADGTGSLLDASALNSFTQLGGGWNVYASNGGEVNLSGLPSLTSTQGISLSDTVGSTVLDSSLTTLSGPIGLTLDGTGTFSSSQITTISGTLTVSGGPLTLSGLTSVDNATIIVNNGGPLTLPSGVSYTGTVILQASGSGALTLTGTSLAEPAEAGSVLLIEALLGGTVTMSTITSISGGPVVLESNDSGSVIDLSGLMSFTSSGGAGVNGGSIDSNGVTLPAAPDVWINAGSGYWDVGSNWLLGTAPSASMNVLINTVAAATVTPANFFENISVDSVTLSANDTLSISIGSELSTSGDFDNFGSLTLNPGGQVVVGGNESEAAAATLNEQISNDPNVSDSFGQLLVTGKATLDGAFNLALLNGFSPSLVDGYAVITAGTVSGTFKTVNGLGANIAATYTPIGFALQVHATPPTFTADTPPAAGVGYPYSYQFQANGTGVTFSATGLPAWAQLDPNTGFLSGTPPATGSYNVTVTASNGNLPNATVTFTLTAQDEPPVFTADSPPAAVGGSPFSYQFQATGVGPTPITYSATGLPGWAQIDPSTGVFSGTPTADGTFNFSVTASNGISPDDQRERLLDRGRGNRVHFQCPCGNHFHRPRRNVHRRDHLQCRCGGHRQHRRGTFTGGVIFNVAPGQRRSSPAEAARVPRARSSVAAAAPCNSAAAGFTSGSAE